MKKGSKMSPEAIAKIKFAKANISDDTRRRMSESKKGTIPWNAGLTKDDPRVANNVRGGWKQSDAAKAKMSKAKEGYIPWNAGLTADSDSRVAQYAKKLTGVPKSEEHCINISLAKQGTKSWNDGLSVETDERVANNTRSMTETKHRQSEAGEIIAWNVGLTSSDDERIELNPNGYKGLTKETSEKIKQATEKQSDTMKQMYADEEIVIWNKGLTADSDPRLKIMAEKISAMRKQLFSEGLIDIWNKGTEGLQEAWNKGLTKNDHPGIMAMSLARIEYMQTHKGNFISTQEDKIADYLTSLGLIKDIDFFRQYWINEITYPYLADFFIPKANAVIEEGAIYWHSMDDRPVKDALRALEMRDKGMIVLNFTDKQVDKDFDFVKRKILEILGVKNG